jgi:hypothetical protein
MWQSVGRIEKGTKINIIPRRRREGTLDEEPIL